MKHIVAYSTACVGRYNKNQNKGFIRYAEEKKTETKTDKKEEKSENKSEQKDGQEQNNPDNATKETGTSLNDALKDK